MREAFEKFVRGYPPQTVRNDGTFAKSPLKELVEKELVSAVSGALGDRAAAYKIAGSIGKGDWTHTPWLVFLDPAVTTSVESNYYVVYLLSRGCDRMYLVVAQGCTILRNSVGIPRAKQELARRAEIMRVRAAPIAKRLAPLKMNLNVADTVWRGKLYEAGCVLGKEYSTHSLPTSETMEADLQEALDIYRELRRQGGWAAEDSMIEEAEEDQIPDAGLRQSKMYRQHRTIERDRGHSKRVKRLQGTRCKGCGLEMSEVYGPIAQGICDAHHLIPLASLDEGEVITFDPMTDFAVLCPSCHRAIHRLSDPSDLQALRAALKASAPAVPAGLVRD